MSLWSLLILFFPPPFPFFPLVLRLKTRRVVDSTSLSASWRPGLLRMHSFCIWIYQEARDWGMITNGSKGPLQEKRFSNYDLLTTPIMDFVFLTGPSTSCSLSAPCKLACSFSRSRRAVTNPKVGVYTMHISLSRISFHKIDQATSRRRQSKFGHCVS